MAITETVTVDAGPAIDQLNALAAAADKAAASFDRIGKGSAGAGLDKLGASLDAAAARIDAASVRMAAAMGRLSTVARGATGGLDAVAGSADKAAAAEDRVAASADAAGAALDRQAVAGERAGKSAAAVASGGGSKLKEWALGAAVVLGYSVDKAMKFNAQMVMLNTQAGVSAKQLPELSKGVLLLAGQVGQSPGNLAESLYHVESNMASLGIKAPQALNMVKIAAEGAGVGHANLVDTTNALTAAVASQIPGVKSYSQAMGVLNATVGAGDMTMQDLTEAMGTGVLAVIKGYGANIKDAGAALAVFGDNNIRGAHAGTALRMAVQSLAVPAKAATKQLADLGLTTTTLADTMQNHGMLAALEQLDQAFRKHGVTAQNEGQVLTTLFGKKAGVGLAILMEQMGRLESKYPALTKAANDFGNAWNTTLQTPQQKLRNLEAGAQAMAVTFGNIAMPAASAILGGLDKAMQFVQSHAFASKGLTVGLGALIAGGLTKGIFSGVESGLSGLGKLGSLLKIPGMDKLANIGQGTGLGASATALDGSASALDGAAASLEGAAASLKGGAAAGAEGGAAGAAGAAGRAEGAAAGGGILAGLGSALKVAGWGAIAGEILRGIGDTIAKAGTPAGAYNKMLQQQAAQGGPASQLHPYTMGGFEGWLTQHIGESVGRSIDHVGSEISHLLHIGGGGGAPGQWTSVLGGMGGQAPPPFVQRGPRSGAPDTYNLAQALAADKGPAAQPFFQIGAGGHPSTMAIPAPLTAGLDAAKTKVQADITAINNVISQMHAKGIKIPAPDMSALDAAKAKLQADLKGINAELAKVTGKPSKIGAPDLSALDAAKARALASAGQIMSGLQTALHRQVKATAPDLSAYVTAAGTAKADGLAISGGLAAGITAGEPAAVAAAHQVAAAVEAALNISLQVRSPSRVTQKIGAQTVEGLIVGLQGGQPALQAAAAALGQTVAKATDITAIESAISKAIRYAGKDSAMVRWLKGEQAKLEALANKRAQVEQEITDSTQIAQSAVSGASILNAGAYTPAMAGGPTSAQTTITGLGYMAGDQTAFAQQLKQLQKMGLNATSLSQLAQAGAQQGLPVAEGLTQGGKASIAQVNALEKTIMKGAAAVGDVGGPAMYQAGKQLGQMAAAGLKSELGAIDAAMKAIAQEIVKDLESELHIKHPGHGGGALPKHGGGGGTVHHHHHHTEVHVTVQGTLVHQQDLAHHLQGVLLQHGSQNWQAGIVIPGRHT